MKKVLSVALAITLLLVSVLSCVAAEGMQPRSSNYFVSYGTAVSHQGGGTLLITFDTTALNIADQLGVATYTVQREDENGNWEDVSGPLDGQTGSGVVSYTYSRYFFGVVGETYRVQVTFVCVMNNGMESKSVTSGIVTAD